MKHAKIRRRSERSRWIKKIPCWMNRKNAIDRDSRHSNYSYLWEVFFIFRLWLHFSGSATFSVSFGMEWNPSGSEFFSTQISKWFQKKEKKEIRIERNWTCGASVGQMRQSVVIDTNCLPARRSFPRTFFLLITFIVAVFATVSRLLLQHAVLHHFPLPIMDFSATSIFEFIGFISLKGEYVVNVWDVFNRIFLEYS